MGRESFIDILILKDNDAAIYLKIEVFTRMNRVFFLNILVYDLPLAMDP